MRNQVAVVLGMVLAFSVSGIRAADDVTPADLKERLDTLVASKKAQAAKFETAITDYKKATNLDPFYQDIVDAFRKDVLEKTNSERFDDAQFNAYFTADYLNNYNGQLKRRQGALKQYHTILLQGETSLRSDSEKANADLAAVNTKLAADGKAALAWPGENATVDAKLGALRLILENLPEQLITIEGLHAKLGGKQPANVAVVPPPISNPAPTQPPVYNPNPTQPPVTIQPIQPSRPIQPTQPPPTVVVAPPILAVDTLGGWVRNDNKVTWVIQPSGQLVVKVKDKDDTKGKWSFDEATGTMTIRYNNASTFYSVTRENDHYLLIGGPGVTPLRFTKPFTRR